MHVNEGHCLGRQAFAALVVLAAASGQGFRVGELTTFTGDAPVRRLPGVRQVVTLRPDGFFIASAAP